MAEPIRIIYIDDSTPDRELVRDVLEKEHNGFQVTEVESRQEFEHLLQENYDLVLSDFNILGFEGFQVIEAVQATNPNLPVIIITGSSSEDVAVEALKRGAKDYVIKAPPNIRHLPFTIQSVLEQKRLRDENEMIMAQRSFQATIFQNIQDYVHVTDLQGRTIYWNKGAEAIFGYTEAEMMGQTSAILYPDQDPNLFENDLKEILANRDFVGEWQGRHKDGSPVWINAHTSLARNAKGEPIGIVCVSKDITEKKRAEEALQRSYKRLANLHQIDQAILAAHSAEEIADVALRHIAQLVPCFTTGVGLFDFQEQQVNSFATYRDGNISISQLKLSLKSLLLDVEKLQMGEIHQIEDYRTVKTIPAQLQELTEREGIRSSVGVPLIVSGELIGVLAISRREPGCFSAEETEILQEVADSLSIALYNARLNAETETLLGDTLTLYRVSNALARLSDERAMFELVLMAYLDRLNLPQGGVLLIDDDGYGTLKALVREGQLVEPGQRFPIADNPSYQRLITTRKPVVIKDAFNNPLLAPVHELVVNLNIKSLLLAPILVRGEVIGALGADTTDALHTFTDHEVSLVQSMADLLGLALENAWLYQKLQQTNQALERRVAERSAELEA